jgi:HD-like signal output (HDOD) protein
MQDDTKIKKFLQKGGKLPTLPFVAREIMAATSKESPDINEIAEIAQCDMALCTAILKTVNSAFYSLPIEIVSIRHAIRYLGLSAIKNLAIGMSIVNGLTYRKEKYFDYNRFWRNSLFGAVTTRVIVESINRRHGENAFLVGMLQDLGIIILVEAFPAAYSIVQENLSSGYSELYEAETIILNINHMEVGGLIASSWGLPKAISTPISVHHCPNEIGSSEPDTRLMANILSISSLCVQSFDQLKCNCFLDKIDTKLNEYCLLRYINCNTIFERALNHLNLISDVFGIKPIEKYYFELMAIK